jgi:hypothetical protein
MQRFINNLLHSKALLMVMLRYTLVALVVLMGLARLRIILILLSSPETFSERDILQEYLMAKAVISGLNPYLPLDKLASMFIGDFPFLTHPAPHPPFVAIISIPFTWLALNYVIITWFILEILCLLAISIMLTILWKGRVDWVWSIIIAFLLLAWYPVMVDLLFGQLTILLTSLVLLAFLAWRSHRRVLAGILIGLSVAIKMFTWPLIVYFVIKKDWRTAISSVLTIIGLNLAALVVIGIGPVTDYYFTIMAQVSGIYHSFLKNFSLWSIGYRFFEGSRPIGENYINAPPLINLPMLAPIVSAGLAISFFLIGLFWAKRSKSIEIALSIMICVLIAVSPITWDHYYIMLIICLVVMLHELSKNAFPTWPTLVFLIIAGAFFLANEHMSNMIILINGGELLRNKGNQITFASSLLEVLPILELVILTFLLGQRGMAKDKTDSPDGTTSRLETVRL